MAVAILEPTTLATDYLLGTLCGACAVLLLREHAQFGQASVRLWAGALAAVAMASFAGGTYHGFHHAMAAPLAAVLWKVTTISMGIASFMLLGAAFTSAFSRKARRTFITAAALKLAIYVIWMLQHNEFRFVIYDYGSTLLILLLFVTAGWMHGVRGLAPYVTSGIFVSIAAAVVQQTGVRLHQHFNHNDLMHVIQMGGVWLLYQGGARLRDAGGLDGRKP